MLNDFDATRAEPYDFTIEADHWAWFEDCDDSGFETTAEMLATLPADIFAALDGHDDYDPSMESMKRYQTRESAMDAFQRALDRVHDGLFVEPIEVVE